MIYTEKNKMSVGFMGRGFLGYEILKKLLSKSEIQIKFIIVCDPSDDVPLDKGIFEKIAQENGIAYFETNNINKDEYRKMFQTENINLGIAIQWLYTIDSETINSCGHGILNLHGGDLPRYRGSACQSWAILKDEKRIGVSCHLMKGNELDAGPICKKEYFSVNPEDNVGELMSKVENIGIRLVSSTVDNFINNTMETEEQNEDEALYCFPRLPRDGEINWNLPRTEIQKLIRAANKPYPGAYTLFRDKLEETEIKKLTILKAEPYDGMKTEYFAVAGHLIQIPEEKKCGVICGDNKLLTLLDVELDGIAANPWFILKSKRQRLGLDIGSELVKLWENQKKDNSTVKYSGLANIASNFVRSGTEELENYETQINRSIDHLLSLLTNEGINVKSNDLRNLSFGHSFYDWEQRERWFGIQIYRSVRVTCSTGTFNTGHWYWADDKQNLHQRLYIGLDKCSKNVFKKSVHEQFIKYFKNPIFTSKYVNDEYALGLYTTVPIGFSKRYSQALLDVVGSITSVG